MSDWAFLNKHRVGSGIPDPTIPPMYRSTEADGFNGLFRFWVKDKHIQCIVSDGEGWQHVSLIVQGDKRPPAWDIMCAVKDLFWADEDWVVQFHPGKSDYVNNHPGCLHLWRCTTQEFPKPPAIMVGIKGLKLPVNA